MDFSNIKFHGQFRDYQEQVLNNIDKHKHDQKIHIVAAPGSGKTILGLELIRRLNRSAIIFSPSITIRQQWKERFNDFFLQNQNIDDLFSCDLKNIKLITSVTYQSLHAALNKLIDKNEDEFNDNDQIIDYSQYDLIKTIKKAKIKTICLDEAHHLRSEWQKSLEKFLNNLGDDVSIISLTATPPYDSTYAEWKRYIDLCGEIDEEIFIPELVSQKTLCPHQDYIYFNYPTDKEDLALKEYKERALLTTNDIIKSDAFGLLLKALFTNYKHQKDLILDNIEYFIAILCLANFGGYHIPKGLRKLVSPQKTLPTFKIAYAEKAFQFIIDREDLFTEPISHRIKKILTANELYDKKKVFLNLNEKLSRVLISSLGKLKSISSICLAEYQSLGNDLRMLILTDYIKKDIINLIGTEEPLQQIGTVSVFESVRRVLDDVPIGILSGSLVIMPKTALSTITEYANQFNLHFSHKSIMNTSYFEITFIGSNKDKVNIITKIFEKGIIKILIGTKSLLGEGWDSPCINSLILASFVGTYMFSNQMRGRAIRIDKNNPNKTANIWHLATIEPQYLFKNAVMQTLFAPILNNNKEIISNDFDTLQRRFNCFLAPAYLNDSIESGIERIEIIHPPYDEQGFHRINQSMFMFAKNREGMKEKWDQVLNQSTNYNVMEISEIPKTVLPKGFRFVNALYFSILIIIYSYFLNTLIQLPFFSDNLISFILLLGVTALFLYFSFFLMIKIIKFISPSQMIKTLSKCILHTLLDIEEIKSEKAKVLVKNDPLGLNIYCTIDNATRHEKEIFAKSISELLSSIENPRYLLIKQGLLKRQYRNSFACPSIIGSNKEKAEVLKYYLEKSAGKYKLIYTRNDEGRRLILKCRRFSYINLNERYIKNRKKLTKWE